MQGLFLLFLQRRLSSGVRFRLDVFQDIKVFIYPLRLWSKRPMILASKFHDSEGMFISVII
jgi:hypothetical protein